MSHFYCYLYGHDFTGQNDHSAVKAVLCNPGGSNKHATWWTRVYGAGIQNVNIIYRAGRDNANANALSRQPYLLASAVGSADDEVQVSSIEASKLDISPLIEVEPDLVTSVYNPQEFSQEQKDDEVLADPIPASKDST